MSGKDLFYTPRCQRKLDILAILCPGYKIQAGSFVHIFWSSSQ